MSRRDHDPFAPHDEPDLGHMVEGDGIEKVGIEVAPDGEMHTLTVEGSVPKAKTSRRKPAPKPKETPPCSQVTA